uniref:Uncharacterized protein n=1 Tax=Knipowitschia caucasica TaxID=637954 RepID=A0AAV2JAL7_KNICA
MEVCGAIYLCIIRGSDTWVAPAGGGGYYSMQKRQTGLLGVDVEPLLVLMLGSRCSSLRQRCFLSSSTRRAQPVQAAAAAPPSFPRHLMLLVWVGSSYGLRARSAGVDQSCFLSKLSVAMEESTAREGSAG